MSKLKVRNTFFHEYVNKDVDFVSSIPKYNVEFNAFHEEIDNCEL